MVKQREVMASPHGAASAAGAPVALGAGRMAVDLAAPSLSDAARTRRVLTLAAVAALMAGCASRPARPTAGGEASAPSARRTPPAPILPYCGQCYWCGEPLPAPRRWCDADCRDDWERDHARRRTRA